MNFLGWAVVTLNGGDSKAFCRCCKQSFSYVRSSWAFCAKGRHRWLQECKVSAIKVCIMQNRITASPQKHRLLAVPHFPQIMLGR